MSVREFCTGTILARPGIITGETNRSNIADLPGQKKGFKQISVKSDAEPVSGLLAILALPGGAGRSMADFGILSSLGQLFGF